MGPKIQFLMQVFFKKSDCTSPTQQLSCISTAIYTSSFSTKLAPEVVKYIIDKGLYAMD